MNKAAGPALYRCIQGHIALFPMAPLRPPATSLSAYSPNKPVPDFQDECKVATRCVSMGERALIIGRGRVRSPTPRQESRRSDAGEDHPSRAASATRSFTTRVFVQAVDQVR